ncbi:hypothetical protein [Aestuariispira insulae]|uniref:Flagellar protein FlaF n=1 Tax=Aestuariispira insulae TaxID=1461337 RepID=A0A3D9HX36_9PROT|nr:hypothetical protein [Aestuariispira insulae]RED53951.1 hypothetical protein DFP90_101750 [Aestuariispira insulae]
MNDEFEIKMNALAGKDVADMIDEMALPFLDLAEKLEAARLNGADKATWTAIMETNIFLWRFIANFLPKNFDREVPARGGAMLEMIADFMTRASMAMPDNPDTELVDKLVRLNLNMCHQILSMRTDQADSASAA